MNRKGREGSAGAAGVSGTGSLRVCVLLGGETPERSVSLRSGIAVGSALLRKGHAVLFLDPATGESEQRLPGEETEGLLERLAACPPDPARILPSLARLDPSEIDLVAILLHGGAGEGGLVQSVLTLAGIPFTGSGPAASHLAIDKVVAKRLLRCAAIPVARELLWAHSARSGGAEEGQHPGAAPPPPDVGILSGYPVVVKPIAGGSTIGLTIVREASQWGEAWGAAGSEIDPERGLLVEEYIPGRELTVGILEDQALPVVEIVPRSGFYDYRRKYTKGETDYQVPARLPEETAAHLQDLGLRAFRALGCRDLGRVDFRVDPEGRIACLEVNTIPGMTATSLLPMAADAVGIGFDALVETICRRVLGGRGAETSAGEGR